MNAFAATRPIRVLHVASGDLWAGAEVQLFTLLTQLHRNDNVRVHAILLNHGELAERLRANQIPVTILDETNLSGMRILLELRRLMKQLRPNVVHTHRQKENVLGSIANLLSTRARCVRTSHGAPEHQRHGWRKLHKRLFNAADRFCGNHLQDRVISVSASLVEILSRSFDHKKIITIENGVDTDALRIPRNQADFRASEPKAIHIGIVGRLEKVKRVDLFLEMAAVLLREHPGRPWRFHVIGGGNLRNQLEQLATQLGVAARTNFHGHRNDSAICLSSLDALVMCSDHEGMPMTPLEAIATGTPVVAHDVGGLSDILRDDAGGVLTREHSGSGYAAALLRLLASDQTMLVTRGQERVNVRFSAVNNARRLISFYQDLAR